MRWTPPSTTIHHQKTSSAVSISAPSARWEYSVRRDQSGTALCSVPFHLQVMSSISAGESSPGWYRRGLTRGHGGEGISGRALDRAHCDGTIAGSRRPAESNRVRCQGEPTYAACAWFLLCTDKLFDQVTLKNLECGEDDLEIVHAKFVLGSDGTLASHLESNRNGLHGYTVGAHSWVRKALGISMEGDNSGAP